MNAMDTITLSRSGRAPLQFTGMVIAKASSQQYQGPCQSRWHELTVYRHADLRLVLAIGYRTQWQGEMDRDEAIICADDAALRDSLAAIDPLADIIGFPPGHQFDEKRAYIEKQLRQCWDAAISELLAQFPECI